MTRRLRSQVLLWAAITVTVAVSIAAVIDGRLGTATDELTADQRTIILKLENVLLHDSEEPQYVRVSSEPQDRGYVTGLGDFATADGSAARVIEAYTARVGHNVLASDYGDIVAHRGQTHSPDLAGLDGYPDAWQLASRDPVFRQVQDSVLQSDFLTPAIAAARAAGVRSPLGIANFFDALLQHGDSDSPDALPALVARTTARMKGPPGPGTERTWLSEFLSIREDTLLAPEEPAHQQLWPLSMNRAEALADLVQRDEVGLAPPVRVNPYGTLHTLDATAPGFTLPPAIPAPRATGTADPSPRPSPSPSRPGGLPSPGATAGPTGAGPPPGTATAFPRLQGVITGIAGLCLDLDGARAVAGRNLKTLDCNGTEAQRWTADTDGALKVRGICVQPEPSAGPAGTEVEVQPCDLAVASQQWRFVNGQIRNAASGLCITVPNDSTEPSTRVIVATCANQPGQQWSRPT